jgi:hypothetical protein
MSSFRFALLGVLAGVMVLAAVNVASASIYTDTDGDVAGTGNQAADITSVQVTNDGTNITFQINLDTAANLSSNHYVNYEIGIQTGTGSLAGQTAISNPYGSPIGISTGMYDWVPIYVYNDGSYGYVAGAQMFQWNAGSSALVQNVGTTSITSTALVSGPGSGTLNPSVTVVFPLANLGPSGLVAGNSFNFDVWTTYSSQGAYDALDNPGTTDPTPGTTDPWNNYPYDSATVAGSTLNTYTVVAVPEPATAAIVGLSGASILMRRRRRFRVCA